MTALTGTGRLIRLALRRDRVLLPTWIVVIAGLTAAIGASVVGLYGTVEERFAAASFSAANVVTRIFDGPAAGTELGSLVLMEGYWLLAVVTGLMGAQAVVRHTRHDEETGRAELIGAAVVGRRARLAAALVLAVGATLAAGVAATLVLLALELPFVGALLAGATLAGNGAVFAAVAAVAAQVAASARAANGSAAAVIGVAFLLRAVGDALGDVGEDGVSVVSAWPSWVSPIGWGQQARAFEEPRWFVLLLLGGAATILAAAAMSLVGRRDLGAGLVPPRPGPRRAAPWLASTLGLAWRLHRGPLLGWATALGVVGVAFGIVGESADELFGLSEDLTAAIEGMAADAGLLELYFAFTTGLLAIAASGYVVQALLRVRTEELQGRVEAVLATAVSRRRWLLVHLLVASAGLATVLGLLGGGGAVGYGLVTGDWRAGVEGMLGGAMVHLPAGLVLASLLVFAVAVHPRTAAVVGWTGFGVSFVFGQLGALFELPQAVLNLSPFTHVPTVPAEPVTWPPLVVLTAIATALVVVAVAVHDRRDLVLAS